MGKRSHKTHKKSLYSPPEEQEKIREAILKVFRARLQSPRRRETTASTSNQKSNNNTPEDRKSVRELKRRARQLVDLRISGSSLASTGHSDGVPTKDELFGPGKSCSKKVKRRRTKAERDKIRSGQYLKNKKSTLAQEKSEYKKHLKRPKVVSSKRPDMGDGTVCSITQNRLTKKLGIFKRGKTSETVIRDPSIVIPDAVKDDTEELLKKIIERSPQQQCANIDEIDIGSLSKCKKPVLEIKKSETQTVVPRQPPTPVWDTSHSCISLHSTPMLSNPVEVLEDRKLAKQTSPPDSMPSSPSFSDIAPGLISMMKCEKHFPNQNYFQTTADQLYKLLKQNSLNDSHSTPVNSTPAAKQIQFQGSVSSATVTRHSVERCSGRSVERVSPASRCSIERSGVSSAVRRPVDGSGVSSAVRRPVDGSGVSSAVRRPVDGSGVSSAKVKRRSLERNGVSPATVTRHSLEIMERLSADQPMEADCVIVDVASLPGVATVRQSPAVVYIHESNPPPPDIRLDAMTLFKLNQEARHPTESIPHHRSLHQHRRHHTEPDLPCHSINRNTYSLRDKSGGDHHRSRDIHHAYEMDVERYHTARLEPTRGNPTHVQKHQQQPVVTEYVPVRNYSPGSHGDYYSNIHHPDDLWPPRTSREIAMKTQEMSEALNILDFADRSLETRAFHDNPCHTTVSRKRDSLHREPVVLRSATPDSEGKPTWYTALPPIPPKPHLPSPSPEKIYPRRMY